VDSHRSLVAQALIVVACIVPADGTGAAKWENGDLGKPRFWTVLDFMGSFQARTACLLNHMAMRILSTIGVVLDLALYLATPCGSLFDLSGD
jgi:hypothetical protein